MSKEETSVNLPNNPLIATFSDIANKSAFTKILVMTGIWMGVVLLGPQWIRAVHMVSGFIWWGMVFFINFIILPSFPTFSNQTKYELLGQVFPKIFKNATTFGFLAVSLGWYYALNYYARWNFSYFIQSPVNILFLIGISLLTGLYLFHTFLERHEINLLKDVANGVVTFEDNRVQTLVEHLLRLPRIGFAIQTFAVIMMFIH